MENILVYFFVLFSMPICMDKVVVVVYKGSGLACLVCRRVGLSPAREIRKSIRSPMRSLCIGS